ncbi:MAG: PfkB family carbohydrate kinase [Granulosicoccaceae bacterium]
MPDKSTLTCIGSLLVDDIAKPLQILHAGASNPVQWTQGVGGVAANAARAAAVHEKTNLISAAGNDIPALLCHDSLSRVNCQWIKREKPFDRYTAVLTEKGDLFVGLASTELAESLCLSDIQAHLTEPASVYAIDANLNSQCLSELVEFITSRHPDAIVAALPISPEKALKWQPCAEQVDVLFCNRREAAALTDRYAMLPSDELATALMSMGFANVVLTDADKPIKVAQQGQLTNVAVPSVSLTGNVNGAGDALAGATLAHFIKTNDLLSSVYVAGLAAARCVLTDSPITYPAAS